MILCFALSFVRDLFNIVEGPNEEMWHQNKGDIDMNGKGFYCELKCIYTWAHTQTCTALKDQGNWWQNEKFSPPTPRTQTGQ